MLIDCAPCVAYARELTYLQGWTDALAPVVLWLKEHADSDTANATEQARCKASPGSAGSALPVADIITTKADIDLCLGSGELLPCPFCGHWAMSHGEKTKSGSGVLWTISCTHTTRLYPDCCASVWAVDEDQSKARAKAVDRWNRRPNAPRQPEPASGDRLDADVVRGG